MSRTLTVTIPDNMHAGEVAQLITHVGTEVAGGLTSGNAGDGSTWNLAPTSPDLARTATPAGVWLAIDLYPESMEVLVAADRDAALEAVRDSIDPHDWQAWQNQLARNNEPGADLPFNGPAADVLQQYWGDFEDASEHGPDAIYIGDSWLVRPAGVTTRTP